MKITHNETKRRFEAELEGGSARLEYRRDGNWIIFTHTEVPANFEGRGAGSELAKTALQYAKDHGLQVEARCPFIAGYIERHPEYR